MFGDIRMISEKYNLKHGSHLPEFEIPIVISEMLTTLPDSYIVGGYVRDSILNIPSHDIDIVTSALPEETKKLYPNHIVLGEKFGTIIVKQDDYEVEVTTMRSDLTSGRHPKVSFTNNIYTDLARRDFTMNAMAVNNDLILLDPQNGIQSLNDNIIYAVNNPMTRMEEDSLRALRAIRFSAQLGFKISAPLQSAIEQTNITNVSKNRIRIEFLKSLQFNPVQTIRQMISLNIMRQIIPDFHLLKTCEHLPIHHTDGNAMEHTFAALSYLLNTTPNQKVAIMLHDFGKIKTKDPQNFGHYYKHEQASVDAASKILKNLNFSNSDQKEILFAIGNHMKMHNIHLMRKSKRYNLYESPYFNSLLKLHEADTNCRYNNVEFVLSDIPPKIPKPLITGHQLISIGFKPSEQLGKVKTNLYKLQIEEDYTFSQLEIEATNLLKEQI